jgi:hypothetical protein
MYALGLIPQRRISAGLVITGDIRMLTTTIARIGPLKPYKAHVVPLPQSPGRVSASLTDGQEASRQPESGQYGECDQGDHKPTVAPSTRFSIWSPQRTAAFPTRMLL